MKKETKTVLVTGSAGFIGSNFVKTFQNRFPKTKIVSVDDLSSDNEIIRGKNIKFFKNSICNEKFLDKVFKKFKPEFVFHFAAIPRVSFSVEHPAETTFVNVYGTALLLEKCRDHKVKKFILSSSSSVYGGAKKLPTKESENPPSPISPYAFQKYADEELCRLFSNLYGLETVCLRYFNVFGPGQYGTSAYSTVVSAWLEYLYFPKTKKLAFIEGDGKQSRDFCFVDNVVDANIRAMQTNKKIKGEAINIANGDRINLLAVKKLIEKYTGKKLILEKRPQRVGDVRHTQADISLAKKLLNYEPLVYFEDGLKQTISWFDGRE